MLRRILLVTSFLILILALGACTQLAPRHPASGAMTVTEEDIGATIEVKTGDELLVTLQGNPSTGYVWEVVPVAGAVLQQLGDWEFEPESDLAGAPGKMTLRFRAVEAGQQALQLVYRRPWETDEPPLNTFEVMVIVNG